MQVIMQKKIISFSLYFIISFSLELNMELPAVQQQPFGTASTEQVIVYKGSINQSIMQRPNLALNSLIAKLLLSLKRDSELAYSVKECFSVRGV